LQSGFKYLFQIFETQRIKLFLVTQSKPQPFCVTEKQNTSGETIGSPTLLLDTKKIFPKRQYEGGNYFQKLLAHFKLVAHFQKNKNVQQVVLLIFKKIKICNKASLHSTDLSSSKI
jgi:hypothetical protein